MPQSDTLTPWLGKAVGLVVVVTLARWALLWVNGTDLFVDEAQYWQFGRQLDWGYFSKPPLIAWTIRATTWATQCDSPFCIRLPGAALHGVTALFLGATAARLYSGAAALRVTLLYLTLPFVALGSLLISTDTVMLPFFAAAIYAHQRLIDSHRMIWAVLAGAAIGLALLAKYAGLYALLGIAVAAALPGEARVGAKAVLVMALTSGLILMPNILWNLSHQFATFWHTVDNVGWVTPKASGPYPGLMGAVRFLLIQFAVFGPVAMVALVAALVGMKGQVALKSLVLVPLVAVTGQSMLDRAYGNWAVAAFLAGSLLMVGWAVRHPRWYWGAMAANIPVAILLPVLTVFPDVRIGGGEPVLARYLGRADLSQQILAEAARAGGVPVVADNRAILADLFYTGRDSGIAIHARPNDGFPAHYYQQQHSLPPGLPTPVLLVGTAPPACKALAPRIRLTGQGAHAGRAIVVTLIDPACLFPPA